MAVRKKGNSFYWELTIGGKRKSGVCKGCTTKREAEQYERDFKKTIAEAEKIEAVDQLFEARRRKLTGDVRLLLADAFTLAMRKPRKRQPAAAQIKAKASCFADFVAFMQGEYPDVTELAAVSRSHAEAYISYIQANGRYAARSSYERSGKTVVFTAPVTVPSARTQKLYRDTCEEVFTLLADDAGISRNPFKGIEVSTAKAETREAFSMAELDIILAKADNFTRVLFTTALCTGLREGDICTLRRDEVDMNSLIITRETRKTGARVEIPIMPPLAELLRNSLALVNNSEYVFPEHAEMYLSNRSGVSYRIKKFLESIGIEHSRVPKGRSKAVSVKDLHSCRHTFCYLAGVNNIPLVVVQSIVGHMDEKMTQHYMAHTTLDDKRSGMAQLSKCLGGSLAAGFTSSGAVIGGDEPERLELLNIIKTADIELVKHLLGAAKNKDM